jgi:hypothetical protein
MAEAVLDAWGAQQERRAREFESARPQPGELHGARTPDDLRAKWRELTEIAAALRARARIAPRDELELVLDQVLEELAC